MGMTIEEIIEELESTKDYPASDPASDEALDGAINTMRRYQKIEEIVLEWNNHCISTQVAISEIANEVLEDGNK